MPKAAWCAENRAWTWATRSASNCSTPTRAAASSISCAPAKAMNYKLTLEYDGSKFSGWQIQNNARTVQGELQRAADELFGAATDVQGAGRTDAGVHALGQVANIKVRDGRRKIAPEKLMADLNEALPSSIAVVGCEL